MIGDISRFINYIYIYNIENIDKQYPQLLEGLKY